ncbi:hypothetical protein F5Y18DRAFT_284036 [Xylariaceae sp. FL1019]|nr:hypothetical protein F5Y18DRAFT_284036 [Xylariaceae sp. FL1019]
MAPITKVWFFKLKKNHSIIEEAFQQTWRELLSVAASYTSLRGEPHTLYQSDDDPDLLAVISGFHSVEVSTEMQNALGHWARPKVEQCVEHKSLYVSDFDVLQMPLESGKISVLIRDTETQGGLDTSALPGLGTWAVKMPDWFVDEAAIAKPSKIWVQIAAAEDAAALQKAGTVTNLTQIMEAHMVDAQQVGE